MNLGFVFFFIILPLLWILFNISWFINICLHELSHALPALLFTKQDVKIFVGTHEDSNRISFKIGKLNFYIKPRLSYIRSGGFCVHKGDITIFQNIIILISGPLLTALISLSLLLLFFFGDSHGLIKALVVILFSSSIISLIFSLYPYKIKTKNNENLLYSDGYQILLLLKNRRNFTNFKTACVYYDNKDFSNAIKYFTLLDEKYISESIFASIIWCYIQLEDYKSAIKFNEQFSGTNMYTLTNVDTYTNLAYIEIKSKDYNSALLTLNKSIKLDENNSYNLNSRGFVNNMLDNYTDAIKDLDRAIEIDKNLFYAYDNRAYSNIKLGQLELALNDIMRSMEFDLTNSYAYLNLGLYYFEKKDFESALENFEKAKQLDESTMFIDENIDKTKEKISTA
ncbi:MAG TPA: M50 family metallopeptidase [Mucilaginibacter sp.]|jgi:Tfp pilus assembly protein PilF